LQERQLLEQRKADAKGKLVDMLLARGMLKIDAMSLADTLEGYPDLFVSALVGDSLLAGSDEVVDDDQTDDGHLESPHMYSIEADGGAGGSQIARHNLPNDPTSGGERFGSFGSWNFPSYGRLHSAHFESEAGQAHAACRESQKEGIFMMMGFASFAVIPSLLWLFLPLWIEGPSSKETVKHSSSTLGSTSEQPSSSPIISVPSLILFMLSALVWCLGVWKSRFVDSNWVVFGMETIAVLLVCVFSAYSVAIFFVYCFGLDPSSSDTLLPGFDADGYS